jgi:hypothetical protein
MSKHHALLALGIVGSLVALVGAQLPELRRYLKIRSM